MHDRSGTLSPKHFGDVHSSWERAIRGPLLQQDPMVSAQC